MKFTRESTNAISIRAIHDGGIRIGKDTYTQTIALTESGVLGDWSAAPFDELTPAHLEPLLESRPDVLLLGTGADNRFAPRDILFSLARRGIGLEVMDTAAAARTFNVLASEGRSVAAVLYL